MGARFAARPERTVVAIGGVLANVGDRVALRGADSGSDRECPPVPYLAGKRANLRA